MRALLRSLALVAVVLSISATSLAGGVVAPADVAPSINSGRVAVLDARPLREFFDGHVPGAQSLTPENLRSTREGVPGEIDPPDVIGAIAGRMGLEPERPILVYSGGPDSDATLVALALRRAGFHDLSVLDGGFPRWKSEGRPVTTARPHVAATHPKLTPDDTIVVSYVDVRAAVDRGGAVIVDARSVEQYDKGHIKGAVSFPFTRDFNGKDEPNAGSWKSAAALASQYRALGITPATPVFVYCNTGQVASSVLYTLRYVVGQPNAKLYDGSFTEWSAVPGAPVETTTAEAAKPPQPPSR